MCTALAGIDVPPAQLNVDRRSAAYEAFRSGRPRLITQDVEAHIGLRELWVASGRPASLLYQPLLHGNNRLGVLVIGWPNELRAEGPRATVAAPLAHEVAAVIARADAMDDLADEAHTDGLTGLPNRRAWDNHLPRIARHGERLSIAVLDRLRGNVTHQRTCSAGLTARQPGESAESAIARADQALYQAKAKRRNRVHVADPPSSASSGLKLV